MAGRRAQLLLVFALAALMVTSFSATRPPLGNASSPGGGSAITPEGSIPGIPTGLDCVGFGQALAVVTPPHPFTAPAAGIVGSTFELEGSGDYSRSVGTPMGSYTIYMANYSGGSLLQIASVPAGSLEDFFVNVTVPSSDGGTWVGPGPYEFWSQNDSPGIEGCANAAFNLTASPQPSLDCLSWTAALLVTSPAPATGSAGSQVDLQGRGFSATGETTIYWTNATGSPSADVGSDAPAAAGAWFNTTLDVPTGYAAGLYAFWAIDGTSDCAGAVFNLTGGPTIALSPALGPGDTDVTVTGSGFSATDTSITITGAVLLFALPCTLSGGSIAGSCFFQVDGGIAGAHTITGVGNVVGGPGDTATATFTLYPSLILDPTSGLIGSSFTITGLDFSPYPAAADITFTGALLTPTGGSDCGAGDTDTLITPDAEGGFVCTFTVPTWANPGANPVVGDDTWTGLYTPEVNFRVGSSLPVPPVITLAPSVGPVGTPLTVTGSGFSPSSGAFVYMWGVATSTLDPLSCTDGTLAGNLLIDTDPSGGFVCTFPVPSTLGNDPIVPGPQTVFGGDVLTGTDSNDATFTLTVPAITMAPSTGPVGSDLTVTGSGFSVTSGVTVSMEGAGTSALVPLSCTVGSITGTQLVGTTASGGFACTYLVPSLLGSAPVVAGPQTVYGTDGLSATVSNDLTFTVTVPSITMTPTSGPAGTELTVTGSGFSVLSAATTTMKGAGTSALLPLSCTAGVVTTASQIGTDASGGFVCSYLVPTTLGGSPIVAGPQAVFGTDDLSGALTAGLTFTLTTPYVVTASSTTGAPGPTTFTVSGLAPSTPYFVYLDTTQGVEWVASYNPLGTCTSSATGTITACSVTIPSGLTVGTYYVDLFQDPNPAPYVFSVFHFAVAAPSSSAQSLAFGLSTLDFGIIAGVIALGAIAAAVVVARRRGRKPESSPASPGTTN